MQVWTCIKESKKAIKIRLNSISFMKEINIAQWDFYFKFISIHYQDVFKVEMGVKISGIYHRIQIYWFGARPSSLGGARMEKPCKNSQKITKNAVFSRFFHPSSS